ncbi:hypothetical protein ACJ41O_004726 [Fusarium nematophilum]
MGRGGRGGSMAPRRPVDLTGVLSVAERNDFVTLITAITETLHNNISLIFDSPPVTPVLGDSGDTGHHHWLSFSLQNGKENIQPRASSQVHKPAQAYQPSKKTTEATDKEDPETITPQLKELKKEALIFFRKWQAIVVQRFRDISVMDTNTPQANVRGQYSAYARLLLLNVASSLNLPLKVLHEEEIRIAQGLSQLAVDAAMAAEQNPEQKQDENKGPRKNKAGMAAISGPPYRLGAQLIAVGIGTPHGGHGLRLPTAAGLLGPMSDNGLAAGSLFGICSARPTSKIVDSFVREIQDFGLVPVRNELVEDYVDARAMPSKDRRLRIVIAVNGWVAGKDNITRPWKIIGSQGEVYVLRWEMSALLSLGTALETVVRSSAWTAAKKAGNSRTIFSSLIEATWPAELMKVSKIIDNPWSIGMVRAEKAGTILADVIMRSKVQGDRPVSLVGFSLAARAIYICLMVLAERRQFGIVDSVVMMGTPAPSESRVWLTLKSVVSGRLINVYSESDYLLGFLYRTSNIHFGVAGLQRIQGADGVENHNVGNLVDGHLRYSSLVGKVLRDVGWEDLNSGA